MVNSILVLILLIVNEREKIFQLLKIVLILPLVILCSYIVLNFLGVDAYGIGKRELFESDKGSSKKSAGTRILAFEAFNRFFWDQPILGTGISNTVWEDQMKTNID